LSNINIGSCSSYLSKSFFIWKYSRKKLLKQLLSLPQNAPDSAIYLLTGFLPVEAQILKKELQLFNNITNQSEESIEKRSSYLSKSFFISMNQLALGFNLIASCLLASRFSIDSSL
jgi:hypothetical protein